MALYVSFALVNRIVDPGPFPFSPYLTPPVLWSP